MNSPDTAHLTESTAIDRMLAPRLEEGEVLGRFVVVKPLGSGSGGVVYAAYDSHLGRRVALKILDNRGTDADAGWRRLVHEAQLIARLDHPNVVTVHDVGAIDGRAFIAMELVDGRDLSEAMAEAWDRKPRPSWAQRVAPLLLAGEGLAAAHAARVIHGDFKPANVLVGRDGRVKVSDFGIGILREPEPSTDQGLAATAEHDATDDVEITLGGDLWGTPLYMAPELFQGHRPTEASDVYSYCASLYQALYGEPPATGRGLLELYTAKLAPKAGRSECIPRKLRDLVLRGLDPDPRGRPKSVAKIVASIRRLQQRRNHRLTIAACVGAAVPLAIAASLLAGEDEPCVDARAELAGVWDDARRADVQAAFDAVAPQTDLQRVRERLDTYATRWVDARLETCQLTRRGEQSSLLEARKVACLDQRRAELEAFVRVLVRADAAVVQDAAEAAADLSPVASCLDRTAFLDGPTPEVMAVVDRVRGELARARGLLLAGKPAEAKPIVDAAYEDATAVDYASLHAEALRLRGLVADALGDYATAEKHLTEAVWIAEGAKADDVAALASLDVLHVLVRGAGRPKEALAWAPHVQVALRRAGLGADEQATFLLARGQAHADLFEHDTALTDYAAAEELADRMERDPRLLRAALANARSQLHAARGEHVAAARELEGVIELYEAEHGRQHPQVARVLDNAAATYVAAQDFEQAIALEDEAIAIATATLGPDHPTTLTAMANRAGVLVQLRRLDEAIDAYEDVLEEHTRALGREHPQTAAIELNLAGALGMAERYDEAAEAATRGRLLLEERLGQDHAWVGFALVNEGSARLERGEIELAIALLERANAVLEAADTEPEKRASARYALANALVRGGTDRARAIDLMKAALAGFEASGVDRPDVEDALRELEG